MIVVGKTNTKPPLGRIDRYIYRFPMKCNKLLITGLSGSGKTTIAEKLKKKHNDYQIVSLDKFEWHDDKDKSFGNKIISEYIFNNKKEYLNLEFNENGDTINNLNNRNIMSNFAHYIVFEYKTNVPLIIEGCQIYDFIDPRRLLANMTPIIINDIGLVEAVKRWKCRRGDDEDWFPTADSGTGKYFIDEDRALNEFIRIFNEEKYDFKGMFK